MNTITILGRKYDVIYKENDEDLQSRNNIAECDFSKRRITVLTHDYNGEPFSKELIDDNFKHEVAHAFLYETGQDDLNDERHAELLSKFATFVETLEV